MRLFSQDRIDRDSLRNWNPLVWPEKLPSKLVEIWCYRPGKGVNFLIYVTVDGVLYKVCSGDHKQILDGSISFCSRYGSDTHTRITYEQLQKVFQSLKIPFDNTAIEITVHML